MNRWRGINVATSETVLLQTWMSNQPQILVWRMAAPHQQHRRVWRELDAWSFHREQSSSDIKATPSNTKDYPIQASSQNQTPSSVSTCDILSICQDRNPNDEPVRILRSRLRQLQTTLQPFNLLTAITFLSTTSLECRGIKLKGDVNMVLEF